MAYPAIVNLVNFFYPIGNTPAVSLTQDVPPERNVGILLLGCGDARNILFTTLADVDHASRQLDITCCDIEKTIVARNILLFTLLVDDVDGSMNQRIWDVYYHLYLDDKALDLLIAHTTKLLGLANSLQAWHSSVYGNLVRFCDEETLQLTKTVWTSFLSGGHTSHEKHAFKKTFDKHIGKSLNAKKILFDDARVLTGFRSVLPVATHAIDDLPTLHEEYWAKGTIGRTTPAENANPTFASALPDNFTLHYGTDPLLGFHLSAACVPMESNSSPLSVPSAMSLKQKLVHTAQIQFKAWCRAFRESATSQKITLRFFIGDALAFCHALAGQTLSDDSSRTSNWYRAQYHPYPIHLAGVMDKDPTATPASFDIIDTSNLSDHIGALNVLSATTPLLGQDPWATLYTEVLVKKSSDDQAMVDQLLCGHGPTIATLFGLVAPDYWMNATTIPDHEGLIAMLLGPLRGESGQLRSRVAWKNAVPVPATNPTIPAIRLSKHDLASVVHQVYRNMFEFQNLPKLFSDLNMSTHRRARHQQYQRASLAWFLKSIRRNVDVEWHGFMSILLDRIAEDSEISISANYIQELYVQLHLLNIYTVPQLRQGSHIKPGLGRDRGFMNGWKVIPSVVCVTLKIPRDKLKVFKDLSHVSTPTVHCMLQSGTSSVTSAWQNIFNQVHLMFGHASIPTTTDNENAHMSIVEDADGWNGVSPLFASFNVPSWILLLQPDTAVVTFGVNSDTHSSKMFSARLGMEMNVFVTKLTDQAHVHITQFMPNLDGFGVVHEPERRGSKLQGDEPRETVSGNLVDSTKGFDTLTARIEHFSQEAESALRANFRVEIVQDNPFSLAVKIGELRRQYTVKFPAPVLWSRARIRVSRKSPWIEIVAPIADHAKGEGHQGSMFIAVVAGRAPQVWNMPYLCVDQLPVLDISKTSELEWMSSMVLSHQWSPRERAWREKHITSISSTYDNVRVGFKDSIISLFVYFAGLQGQQSRIFGIVDSTMTKTLHIIIIPNCLRFDPAHGTVVLDCLVLPLFKSSAVSMIKPFLDGLRGLKFHTIKVDEEELALWRKVLPSFVEQCRTWEHCETCEYLLTGKIPLSTTSGEQTLCSCGHGKFPSTMTPEPAYKAWDKAAAYFIRAAISPVFPAPMVEQSMQNAVPTCRKCSKSESLGGGKLLTCARCQMARYCSKECQKGNWAQHKGVCRAPAAAA